jgi:hypothetical protein
VDLGGRNKCAEGDLKPLEAGLPYPKGSTNGLLKLEGANHGVALRKLKKTMLYGQESTI